MLTERCTEQLPFTNHSKSDGVRSSSWLIAHEHPSRRYADYHHYQDQLNHVKWCFESSNEDILHLSHRDMIRFW